MTSACPTELKETLRDLRGAHITAEQINALPLFRYNGAVTVVEDDLDARHAATELEGEAVLGFDTESRPAFEKGRSYPVALIQLAAAKKVYIFRLGALSDLSWFSRLFSAAHIIKAGVAVDQDVAKLREQQAFDPSGFVDLAHLAARLGLKNRGVRGLAALFLGFRVSKNMRRSNWDRVPLSDRQIAYAAADAWLCRELYLHLSKLLHAVTSNPALD